MDFYAALIGNAVAVLPAMLLLREPKGSTVGIAAWLLMNITSALAATCGCAAAVVCGWLGRRNRKRFLVSVACLAMSLVPLVSGNFAFKAMWVARKLSAPD